MLDQQYLYFSRFEPTLEKGGGSRRVMQIMEVFADLNFEFISFQRGDKLNKRFIDKLNMPSKKRLKKIFVTNSEYKLWGKNRRDAFYRLRFVSRKWGKLIKKSHNIKLVLIDDPLYFIPLVKRLLKFNIPVIAVCHNLESLVSSNVIPHYQRELFKREIKILSECTRVITISREETVLLNNLNHNALFLPYYPVKVVRKRMQKVRQKRKETKKKDFLLVGSAINVENRQGMIRVITQWERENTVLNHDKLLVAGFKTDIFLKTRDYKDNVEFLGPLSNEKLDERLTSVKACICYQDQGGGALTRICEMLLAGVPVVANSHAARSYYNMNGVVEFRDLNDLKIALKQIDMLEDQIPLQPEPDPTYLVSEIKKIMEHQSTSHHSRR